MVALLNDAGVGGPVGRLSEIDPAEARRHLDILTSRVASADYFSASATILKS